MATEQELDALHRAADVPASDDVYPDSLLADILDAAGSVTAAAAVIWREKAAAYAKMVTMAESGSSRTLSDLYKNALAMADANAAAGASTTPSGRRSFTTQIVRP